MAPRTSLLSRLLVVATAPALVLGCDVVDSVLGERVDVPRPPVSPAQAVPSASSTAALPGDQALPVCGSEYHHRPVGRTGGPYANSYCYAPVPPATGCLPATNPALARTLRMTYAQCVYDGPHTQSDASSGAPWCCYNLGFMGEGRPLLVTGTRRQATLVRMDGWG